MLQAFCELEAEPKDLSTHCHGITFSWRLPDLQHGELIWSISTNSMPLLKYLSGSLNRWYLHLMKATSWLRIARSRRCHIGGRGILACEPFQCQGGASLL